MRVVRPLRLVYRTTALERTPITANAAASIHLPWNGVDEQRPVVRLQAMRGSAHYQWHLVDDAGYCSACVRAEAVAPAGSEDEMMQARVWSDADAGNDSTANGECFQSSCIFTARTNRTR